MNESVSILRPPPAFAGDARPKFEAAPRTEPPPEPAPRAADGAPHESAWRRHGDLFLVLVLTLLGGALRFAYLDRPPIWGDEGMTFMRVCGTYQQMLDALQDWGFAPLHYELYWWIGQQTTLTPFMMRLVPAIAGTLMVPAMYWLGRELAGRKVALVAALFAATSAYLLNYSRDAKMYMHFWLFCAVNFAALLWWLRARSGVAWWSWVASGVAMLGFNMLGLAVLGVELLAVILTPAAHWRSVGQSLAAVGWSPVLIYNAPYTRLFMRFRWPPLLLFLLGGAVIAIGPIGYYKYFNKYTDRLERRGLAGGGLNWVEGYNRGRDALDLVAFTTTAHLYSWEWPRYDPKRRIDDAKEIAPRAVKWLKISGLAIVSLLALGLFPWPRALTAFARPGEGDATAERRFWPWPLAVTIVLAWIVVPAYAFYCASMDDFVSPLEGLAGLVMKDVPRIEWPNRGDWGTNFFSKGASAAASFGAMFSTTNLRTPTNWQDWLRAVRGVELLVACFVFCGLTWRERVFKLSVLVTIGLALFVACCLVYAFYVPEHDGSIWMPRYLGFAWPAVAVAVAVLLLRLPTRPLRWAAVALLVGVNLAQYSARLFAGSEPPTDRMARDLLDAQPQDATSRMYWGARVSPSGAPGGGYLWSVPGGYYLSIFSGRPTTPDEMITAFHAGRFAQKWKKWNASILPLEQYVANDVKRTPRLSRVVTWENFTPRRTVTPDDKLAARLGETWKPVKEELFYVRDHWTWRNMMTLRRREYARVGAATQPATQRAIPPTTRPN